MKLLLVSLVIAFSAVTSNAQTTEVAIAGNWYCEDLDKATVNVYKAKDGTYYGKIIKSENSKSIGKMVLKRFAFNTNDVEWKGQIVPPTQNLTINGTAVLLSDGRLKIAGKKLIITKTFYFKRV